MGSCSCPLPLVTPIYIPNPASVALHEAVGFQPFAVFSDAGYKLGGWRDVGWWHIALRGLPVAPQEPIAVAQACRLPEWDRILCQGKFR